MPDKKECKQMTNEMIITNLITILSSALGAGIGGFFAFQIAIYQIKVGKKTELEKVINPFLFEMKLQCEKAKSIHDGISELKSKRIKTDDWKCACINIIKNEENRIDDPYPNWLKVRSELYVYSYSKCGSDNLFQVIEGLVIRFRYLAKAQNTAEKFIEEDVTCIWIDEEYKRIVQIVSGIADSEWKKFFEFLV